jgi:predicted permease
MKDKPGSAWEARLFRMWLRLLPTRFGPDVNANIVSLFEDRLDECGSRTLARVGLLVRSLADALWHGLGGWLDGKKHTKTTQPTVNTPRGLGVESMLHDIRFAVRSLRKRALFTTIAVGALGLGIGGTTAMFSIVDGVLIRDLRYRDPGKLVNIWMAFPSWRGQEESLNNYWDAIDVRAVDYLNIRDHASTLSSVAAFWEAWGEGEAAVTGEGQPEALSVFEASANLFETLGVQPVLGRVFFPEEVTPEGDPARVAILSFEIWKRRFAGSRDVLGQQILLNGISFEIVGVLPEGFRLASKPFEKLPNAEAVDDGLRDIWVPLGITGCFYNCAHFLQLVGRLAQRASVDQARAEVQTLLAESGFEQIARVVPTKEIITRGFGTPLSLLLGAAAVLMLIACANVTGLLIGEAPGRQHELTVRSALGASRGQVVSLLLTESVLLSLMGAALGVVLAWLGTDAVLAIAPALPRPEEIGISGRILLFATAVGIGTGLLFGVVPALSQTKASVGSTLRVRNRSGSARLLQTTVVSAQIGLTVVLLVAGGLFVRSFVRIMSVDPGFDPDGLVTQRVTLFQRISRQQRELLVGEILRVTRDVPGVRAVSVTTDLPFPGRGTNVGLSFQRNGEQVGTTVLFRATDPTYVETMGIPLLRGRLLSDADEGDAPGAMLVSESLAERNWPNESPLGVRISFQGLDYTIVGVVGDVRQEALGIEVQPVFYVPVAQAIARTHDLDLTMVVKMSSDPVVTLAVVRNAIWSVNPDIVLHEANTMAGLVRTSEADERFRALLMWTFATIAGVLAAVGIFGMTARAVSARAREMGIRSALGADGRGLIRLVLKDGLLSATLGLVLGLVVASWASSLIAHLLYEIEARDPWTYLGAVVLSITTCTLAAYLPARRVTKIDPMEVLAEE